MKKPDFLYDEEAVSLTTGESNQKGVRENKYRIGYGIK